MVACKLRCELKRKYIDCQYTIFYLPTCSVLSFLLPISSAFHVKSCNPCQSDCILFSPSPLQGSARAEHAPRLCILGDALREHGEHMDYA